MARTKKVPLCPSDERIWTTYQNAQGETRYILTSKKDSRAYYYLYRIEDGKRGAKLGKAQNPKILEAEFIDSAKKAENRKRIQMKGRKLSCRLAE